METIIFKIDAVIEQRLMEDKLAYANFLELPEIYKRVRIDTIQSSKRWPELFERRLNKFIANTRENKIYGQWNDNGRLLEDEKFNN